MERARPLLMDQKISLWPNACDHESVSDIGWLLYSTREQDSDCIAEMLSSLVGEMIGAKWRPIRTADGFTRKKDNEGSAAKEPVRALHLEGASDRVHNLRDKLAQWYGTSSTSFPDGTKMRLIPPYSTMISRANKMKYGSIVARQEALNA